MKKLLILRIIIILLLLLLILLVILLSNGIILNLQGYLNFKLIPLVFWSFIALLSISLMSADIGFLKIVTVLGAVIGVFTILFLMANNTSKFEMIESNDYKLIIETTGPPEAGTLTVYKTVNPFYSEFVDSISAPDYYEISYEIIGDTLLVSKCTAIQCLPVEIELE